MDSVAITRRAKELLPRLIKWRRLFHKYPELSFQEEKTAARIVEILKDIQGMEIRTGVGGTGVIASLSKGEGACIALRADMDALPISEANDVPYRSRHPGVMHACGHDAHIAILLGAACLLGERWANNPWCGEVRFLFQPAEECGGADGLSGAPLMIREGVLEGVEGVVALHMHPGLPQGAIQVYDGPAMASTDFFYGSVRGTGGHGAYPHLGVDPTWLLLPVLQALHGIVSRRVSPMDPAVVSIGQINGGSAENVIPEEVRLKGTIRSYDPTVRKQLIQEVKQAFSLTVPLGGDYHLQVEPGEPVLMNHPAINHRIVTVVRELFPDFPIHRAPFGMGGEDFSHMTALVPGAMFFLGCAKPDGVSRELHTPVFDLDENCLADGAAILAETALRFLQDPKLEGKT